MVEPHSCDGTVKSEHLDAGPKSVTYELCDFRQSACLSEPVPRDQMRMALQDGCEDDQMK